MGFIAKHRNRVIVGASTIALALVGVACGSSSNATTTPGSSSGGQGSGTTIKIGAIVSTSGASSSLGDDELKGMQTAVDAINAAGGIKGSKIDLVVKDDASDASSAVLAFRDLVTNNHVVAVVGPGSATTSPAVAEVADQMKTPMIAIPSVSGNVWEGPNLAKWAFGISGSGTTLGTGCISDYAAYAKAKGLNIKTIAIGSETTGGATVYANAVAATAPSLGWQVVTNQKWTPTATDVSPQIIAIKAKSPDLIDLSAYEDTDVLATKSLSTLGVIPRTPVVQCSSLSLTDYTAAVKDLANGMFFVATAADLPLDEIPQNQVQRAEVTAFADAYHKTFGANATYSRFTASGWDVVKMMDDAITKAGTKASDIRAAIEGFTGRVGAYSIVTYTANRHRPSASDYEKSTLLMTYQHGALSVAYVPKG